MVPAIAFSSFMLRSDHLTISFKTQFAIGATAFAGASYYSTPHRLHSDRSSRLGISECSLTFVFPAVTGFANTSVKADDKVPHTGIPGTRFERTFIAIKPDGVQRGIVGEIIQRFEKKGYKLVGLKVGIKAPQTRRSAEPAQDSDSPLHLLAPRRSSSPPSSSPSSTTLISRRSLSSPAW
jgi:hypothetical protein